MAPATLFSHKGLRVHPSVRRVMERHPNLDAETEKTLLLAAQSGDLRSRQKLINHNLALICKLGGTYRHEQTDNSLLDDNVLLNQGVIGLHRAIDKWRPDGGSRLATFAAWHIRKAMRSDDCLYADETIRIPESTRIQLKKINEVEAQRQEVVLVDELAAQTEIGVKRLECLINIHQPSSLNVADDQEELIEAIPDVSISDSNRIQRLLESAPAKITNAIEQKGWQDVLAMIPAKLVDVLRLRFWEESTFKAISQQLSIPLNNVAAVLTEGIEALRLQILGRKSLIPSIPRKLEIEPIGNGEQLCLDLSIPSVVESGRKLLTRGIGFGIQAIKQAKRAVQQAAQALGNPLQVLAHTPSIPAELTTHPTTTPMGSAGSTSASSLTSVVSFAAAQNNIVDFERSHDQGSVSPNYYSPKEYDSGGLAVFRNISYFVLGLLFSSALHVSGVVDVSRWGRIVNSEEISDIADDVGDAVKEKLKK